MYYYVFYVLFLFLVYYLFLLCIIRLSYELRCTSMHLLFVPVYRLVQLMSSTPFPCCSLIVWMDDYGFTSRDHLYVFLEGKEKVPNNVVDMLILIMCDKLLINPSAYPKHVAIK